MDKSWELPRVLELVELVNLALLVIGIGWAFSLWFRGISPALLRLGNGLAKRKIALFAKGDNVSRLRSLLVDSRLFRDKNICEIRKSEDVGKAESATLYLVHWHDWASDIEKILGKKPDECALIVYAPYDQGKIPDAQMKNLDGKRHTAVESPNLGAVLEVSRAWVSDSSSLFECPPR